MFRYSLLHKRIIVPSCPSTKHFWQPIDHDYLFMHLLSYIHKSSWNCSRIVINSSFHPLIIHNNSCTTSIHSCIASQHLHPYLCMHIYNIYSYFSYASIECITTRFIKSLNAYPLNATLYWFRNTMHSNIPWPNHDYLI